MIRPDDIEPEERAKDKTEDVLRARMEALLQGFEPQAREIAITDLFAANRISTTISLKRIADALESPAFADKIERALATGIYEGAQNAIGAWLRSR